MEYMYYTLQILLYINIITLVALALTWSRHDTLMTWDHAALEYVNP